MGRDCFFYLARLFLSVWFRPRLGTRAWEGDYSLLFLSEERSISRGLFFGYTVMAIHALSGMLITLAIWFFLSSLKFSFVNDAAVVTQKVSFFLILLIGFYLLYHNIQHARHAGHDHGHATEIKSKRQLFITAFAIGIVPCPGTSAIIVFYLSNQVLYAGMAAVLFIALGMGLTISLFAVVTVMAQKFVLGLISNNPRLYRIGYLFFSQLGALVIITVAIVMLI